MTNSSFDSFPSTWSTSTSLRLALISSFDASFVSNICANSSIESAPLASSSHASNRSSNRIFRIGSSAASGALVGAGGGGAAAPPFFAAIISTALTPIRSVSSHAS